MRLVLATLVVLLAGCPGSLADQATGTGDGAGSGSGSGGGAGGSTPAECLVAADCTPAGPKCCDCPTHALPVTDPSVAACANVGCPTPSCGSPMEAACEAGKCVLVCSPVACTPNVSCANGFATDANGCLTCDCAMPTASECAVDGDCARVKADCCGCTMGGNDTAVPVSQVDAWNASLMCPQNPSCPAVDTCAPDLAARCVAGACSLVSGPLPTNACGRPDLAVCTAGEVCTVNANDQATMQGVGVCQPAP